MLKYIIYKNNNKLNLQSVHFIIGLYVINSDFVCFQIIANSDFVHFRSRLRWQLALTKKFRANTRCPGMVCDQMILEVVRGSNAYIWANLESGSKVFF